jgi:hypothetical protein
VLTLARGLGAGEAGFPAGLAGRLGLTVHDRDLLEEQAARLGVGVADLDQVDEQPAGLLGRFRAGGLHRRYFEVMGELMAELAARGGVLLVGRGGSGFLRDDPRAFHLRSVAAANVRVRGVMEHRWLREGPARQAMADSDARRAGFYREAFGGDWASPLEYHATVNAARLGPGAVELVAALADRKWEERGRRTEDGGQ